MKMKVFMVAAVTMICALATVCYTDASDADISTDAPDMKFFVYVNDTWVSYTGQGYNAAQALADTNISYTWASEVVDGTNVTGADYTYTYTSYGYTGTNINPYYGELATVNGSSDFTVYYFDGYNWVTANAVIGYKSIGFYKPFDDYTLKTANIAFVPTGVSPNTIPTDNLASIENVIPAQGSPDSAYAVYFYINNAETPIVGYGSDCATAFKDAMTRNNIPCTINLSMINVVDSTHSYINTRYYGQVTQIGNEAQSSSVVATYDSVSDTTTVVGTYDYWNLRLVDDSYAPYMLGFYSPLSYAPEYATVFTLEFIDDEEITWVEQGDTTGNYQ